MTHYTKTHPHIISANQLLHLFRTHPEASEENHGYYVDPVWNVDLFEDQLITDLKTQRTLSIDRLSYSPPDEEYPYTACNSGTLRISTSAQNHDPDADYDSDSFIAIYSPRSAAQYEFRFSNIKHPFFTTPPLPSLRIKSANAPRQSTPVLKPISVSLKTCTPSVLPPSKLNPLLQHNLPKIPASFLQSLPFSLHFIDSPDWLFPDPTESSLIAHSLHMALSSPTTYVRVPEYTRKNRITLHQGVATPKQITLEVPRNLLYFIIQLYLADQLIEAIKTQYTPIFVFVRPNLQDRLETLYQFSSLPINAFSLAGTPPTAELCFYPASHSPAITAVLDKTLSIAEFPDVPVLQWETLRKGYIPATPPAKLNPQKILSDLIHEFSCQYLAKSA